MHILAVFLKKGQPKDDQEGDGSQPWPSGASLFLTNLSEDTSTSTTFIKLSEKL